MKNYIVTVIDTVGIQKYIFGSNSLQHNVGASGLVHCATHDWVFKGLTDLGKTNINRIDTEIDNKKVIEDGNLDSELVYAGGGNAIIVFRTKDLAIKFTQNLTVKVLLEAPGLQLIISHSGFDWDTDSLPKEIDDTKREVDRKKLNHEQSRPLLGLGVTADCQYTGLPANDIRLQSKRDEKKKLVYISNEVGKKLDFFHSSNERLHGLIPQVKKENLDFIYDFNEFGTKHESSYIAVIHTDGNGMGNRIKEIANNHTEAIENRNRNYINAIRAFSKSIGDAAEKALQTTINQILMSRDKKNGKIGGIIEIRGDRLPFRPIVFGGDDVTFVCDGRMGLSLANFYLNQLKSTKLSDKDFLYARAGVVVVKSHHPFSRAVALAEELAETAKKYIQDQKKTLGEENLSAIDWHFASSGPIGKLSDIRQREYTVKFDNNIDGKLNMRPLRLGSQDKDWHSWETFTAIMKEFNQKKWSEKHNKLIGLREPLRAGPEAVQQYRQLNKLPFLYSIPGDPGSAETGWVANDCCTCFDAIEALDFFVTLKGDN